MTERWRKRLRDLDAEGPSEDVFARAKEGPTIPDASLATPSTTTRIATGIAAFLVFGLAISVFVIPILRMSDPVRTGGSMGLQPLWPYSTLEEAAADQERIDESGADDPALHPDAVVERFAHEVMGWDEFTFVVGPPTPSTPLGGCAAPPSPGTSGPPMPVPCTAPSSSGSGISSPPPNELTFVIAVEGVVWASDVRTETSVVVYQPLGVGPDDVWGVQSVRTDFVGISSQPGDVLADGDYLDAVGPPMTNGVLRLVSAGACTIDETVALRPSDQDPDLARSAQLDVVLDASCTGASPGRVFAMAADASEEELLDADPFGAGAPPLIGLTAAPVIVDFETRPATQAPTTEPAPPPAVSSSPPPLPGTSTYVDKEFGWTADVPDGWAAVGFEHQDRVSSWGAYFLKGEDEGGLGPSGPPMESVVVGVGEVAVFIWTSEGGPFLPPADDDLPPPTFAELEPGGTDAMHFELAGSFRANGRPYSILVKGEKNAVFEAEDEIGALVGSIEFPGWEPGKTRDGLTALWELEDSVTWMNLDGEIYLAFGPDPAQIYGPIPTCGEGQNMTEDDQGNAILECPDGSTIGYDRHGLPFDTNPPSNRVPCELNPVIRAWNGTLLAVLDSKVISVA